MTKYAILGGGGSFGIHTALYLYNFPDTEKVIGIGRNPLRESMFSLDINALPKYEYRALHITYELDLLLEYLDKEQPDIIINFAAQGEGAVSWKHSWRFFETNSMALARLAEELQKRSWMKHFIQIGTSEMYGSVDRPVNEQEPIKPSSPYAASKVAFDMYLESVHRFQGFPMTIIRPSNCYCPGQLLHRIVPKCFWAFRNKVRIPLHGGGRAEKSYLHARDLARAIHLASCAEPTGQIYNVGPENPTSIRSVVQMCADTLGIEFDQLCEMAEDRLGQDSRYWLDSSKIREKLHWEPTITWQEGLKEMKDWMHRYWQPLGNVKTDYILRA